MQPHKNTYMHNVIITNTCIITCRKISKFIHNHNNIIRRKHIRIRITIIISTHICIYNINIIHDKTYLRIHTCIIIFIHIPIRKLKRKRERNTIIKRIRICVTISMRISVCTYM